MSDRDFGALLETSLCASELIVALYDAGDVLRFANAAYAERFLRGLAIPAPFAEVLRHGHRNGFGVRIDCGDVEQFLSDILKRRRAAPSRAFQVDTCDGEWIWMTETVSSDGWLLGVGSNITSLKNNERVLRREKELAVEASRLDGLTGVANRRHLMELAEGLFVRSKAEGQPLSAALIDIDHFKSINDRFGHDVGDHVLRGFAQRFKSGLRDGDVFGRMGGEEFLVLLPATSARLAEYVIGRLRQMSTPPADPQLACTFSAGVAEAGPAETLDALMKRADVALYEAKAAGRNRTVVAGLG